MREIKRFPRDWISCLLNSNWIPSTSKSASRFEQTELDRETNSSLSSFSCSENDWREKLAIDVTLKVAISYFHRLCENLSFERDSLKHWSFVIKYEQIEKNFPRENLFREKSHKYLYKQVTGEKIRFSPSE